MKGRLEDHRMLTGRGRYVSDWNLPGQAYGHFLRSDRAHAKIVSIQKEGALKMPGVIAVITGEELAEAGLKPIPAAAPFKWQDGSAQRLAQRPSLAHEVVRHVGEPVALIVAETAAQAQDAAEAVMAEYEDLPAVDHGGRGRWRRARRSSTRARPATWCSISSAATRPRPTPRSRRRRRW